MISGTAPQHGSSDTQRGLHADLEIADRHVNTESKSGSKGSGISVHSGGNKTRVMPFTISEKACSEEESSAGGTLTEQRVQEPAVQQNPTSQTPGNGTGAVFFEPDHELDGIEHLDERFDNITKDMTTFYMALIFMRDSFIVAFLGFAITLWTKLSLFVLVLCLPEPIEDPYCLRDSGTTDFSIGLLFGCSTGRYFRMIFIEAPGSFLGALCHLSYTRPDAYENRKRFWWAVTISGMSLAAATFSIETFYIPGPNFFTQVIFACLMMILFYDKELPKALYAGILFSTSLPVIVGSITVRFLSQDDALRLSYWLPPMFFLISFATKRVIFYLTTRHQVDIQFDSTLIIMHIIFQILQLVAGLNNSHEDEVLKQVAISMVSTIGSYSISILTNIMLLKFLKRKQENKNYESSKLQHPQKEDATTVMPTISSNAGVTLPSMNAIKEQSASGSEKASEMSTNHEISTSFNSNLVTKIQSQSTTYTANAGRSISVGGKYTKNGGLDSPPSTTKDTKYRRSSHRKERGYSYVKSLSVRHPSDRALAAAAALQRKGSTFSSSIYMAAVLQRRSSLILWKRMAIAIVMGSLTSTGTLPALLFCRRLMRMATLVYYKQCKYDVPGFWDVEVPIGYYGTVLLVIGFMWLFVAGLEVLQMGFLRSWVIEGRYLIKLTCSNLILFSPWFFTMVLMTMVAPRNWETGNKDLCSL